MSKSFEKLSHITIVPFGVTVKVLSLAPKLARQLSNTVRLKPGIASEFEVFPPSTQRPRVVVLSVTLPESLVHWVFANSSIEMLRLTGAVADQCNPSFVVRSIKRNSLQFMDCKRHSQIIIESIAPKSGCMN